MTKGDIEVRVPGRPPRSRVLLHWLWVLVLVGPAVTYAITNSFQQCGAGDDGGREMFVGWVVDAAVIFTVAGIPLALVLVIVFLAWEWWWRACASAVISVVHAGVLLSVGLSCGVGS